MHVPVYIAAALGGLVLISVALFTYLRPEPRASLETWTGGAELFSWQSSAPLQRNETPDAQPRGVETLGVVPLPTNSVVVAQDSLAQDLVALLAKLTAPSTSSAEPASFVPSSYAYIPQGLISFGGPEKPLSPEQQAFREYGNALGLSLQSFADLHTNMVEVLKDQAEDRTNAGKNAALKRLADDFSRLGDDIAGMDSVPAPASNAHAALAAAYRDVGTKLGNISGTSVDDAFLAAVNTYNASAEELSRRLVAISDMFVARDVGFSTSDPGSIFMFSGNSSF